MNKALPSTLTSHDLLKAFAVIIMIIDHIGYYFYPDDMWWRAVGRIGFPIWFYLAGYARGRDIPRILLGGGLFLLAMNFVVGETLFPLNALFTIMILRLCIDPVMNIVRGNVQRIWGFLFIFTVLFLPTTALTEYGTLAAIFAMFGYMVRHREDMGLDRALMQNYMVSIAVIFLGYQGITFGMNMPQFVLMAVGTMSVCLVLGSFRSVSFDRLDAKMPAPFKAFIQFCGRNTLQIYVAHLTVFKLAALVLTTKPYALFTLRLFS